MDIQKYNIETLSLLLRPFQMDDSLAMYELSQEAGMKEWIPDQVYEDESRAKEALKYLISQYNNPISPTERPFVLGIALKETKLLIGHVGLSPVKDGVEIGYAIGDKQTGKGYATEAVLAASSWAIKNLGISEIYGIVASDNTVSCKVLEKATYQLKEEICRAYHGKSRNIKIYEYSCAE